MATVLVFGFGLIGSAFARRVRREGHEIIATARTPDKRQQLAAEGIRAIDPADPDLLAEAVREASAILVTPAPTDEGCLAFAAVSPFLDAQARWIGYLSTTGVYGDHGGGWVFEHMSVNPQSPEAARRVRAENQWLILAHHTVAVFRLPGLYGRGRSVIDRLKDGTARRIHKPGQVFSRLYDQDCAEALWLSMQKPRSGAIYNLCDDEPAPADTVIEYAARTFGLALPPLVAWDDPALSPAVRRFYAENKRVSNALAKAELGWRLRFPTYREGLTEAGKPA